MRHGFASDGAVTLGMVMGVSTGNISKGGSRGLKALPSVTAPALAKPCTPVQTPSPSAKMLWPKKYAEKNFSQAEKFFPSGPDSSIATATNQLEKTVQPLEKYFFEKSTTVMC